MKGAELLNLARGYIQDYLVALEAFVNLDSGTHDVACVDNAGRFAAQQHTVSGARVEWIRSANPAIGDTYVARWDGDDARRVVMLGHHDTVFAAGTTRARPFGVQEGRACGPGVMDMKGGVMLGAFAMRLLRDAGVAGMPSVVFVGNPDEEIGSPTSRAIIEREARDANLVLVLEPGREAGAILTTRKGVGMYEIVVEGRAAHAGARPEDGRSAVLELAHKTIALHALNNLKTGTTVNVGVVNGGTRRNVVPEHASALVDVRVVTAHAGTAVDAAIRDLVTHGVVEGTSSSETGGLNRPPMEKTADTDRALAVGRRLVEDMRLPFSEIASGGGSDGNFTAAFGIPTLDGLGPVGGNAHSPDEWLDVTTLAERLALVAGLILHAPH